MNLMFYYAGNPTWNWEDAEKYFENYWANEIASDSTDNTGVSNAAESHAGTGPMSFNHIVYDHPFKKILFDAAAE